jgi:hypothetical protein
MRMAERIAARLDARRFGVRGLYVFGSTKNATAGAGSDLDLIVHVDGDAGKRRELEAWLEGWSLALAETNYLRTGYRAERLLDVLSSRTRTSCARRATRPDRAVTDAARRCATSEPAPPISPAQLPRRPLGPIEMRTTHSSGPSCAAPKSQVRPRRSRKDPLSLTDSCTCPWSVTWGWRVSMKRRTAMLPTWTSRGTWSTLRPSRPARSRQVR